MRLLAVGASGQTIWEQVELAELSFGGAQGIGDMDQHSREILNPLIRNFLESFAS